MKKKLIVGNWKMNGSLAANESLVQALRAGLSGGAACSVALAAPAPYLAQLQALCAGSCIEIAAQDVSQHEAGAYTGHRPRGRRVALGAARRAPRPVARRPECPSTSR